MAIQFAKDEKVIKSFDYAATGYNKKRDQYDTFKSLIVTNKRIIHESVSERRGNEVILRQEMPVSDAKYIKTTMGKSSSPEFLVQAILFAVLAVAIALVSVFEFAAKFQFVFWILAAPFAILAIVKLCTFLTSCSRVVSFSIFTDHVVTPVICSTAIETNTDDASGKKAKKEPALEIRVNSDVAREIADELGAAILDAIAYQEETPAQEVEEAIPAFATVGTETTPIDIPEAEVEEFNEEV